MTDAAAEILDAAWRELDLMRTEGERDTALAALRDLLAALEDAEISQPGAWERLREARARARALLST